MPEISRFYGIIIRMFFGDHEPPHFHARYNKHEAKVTIENLEVIAGSLPRRAMSHVLEWAFEHRNELSQNWQRMQHDGNPKKIAPLK